ncbi:hypothetical protein Ahia01_000901100 [Argonauta hians]
MAESGLLASVFGFLCEEEGYTGQNVYSIYENVGYSTSNSHITVHQIRTIINDNPSDFHQDGTKIYPKTAMRICCNARCHDRDCTCLHLCKFYLLSGTCSFKDKCAFGHDFQSKRCLKTLEKYGLTTLSFDHVRNLLKVPCNRSPETTPAFCIFYNTKNGCRDISKCRNLHLCRNILEKKTCEYSSCVKNHNVNDENVLNILSKYGFEKDSDTETLIDLLKTLNVAQQNETPTSSSSKLCRLSEGCYVRNCQFIHYKRPFLWRYCEDEDEEDEGKWYNFPDDINETLEKNYSDPSKTTIKLSQNFKDIDNIDFGLMNAVTSTNKAIEIKRLEHNSTWIWYSKCTTHTWKEISSDLNIIETSADIENLFKKSTIEFSLHMSDSDTYATLNFKQMKLIYNSQTYLVCRRPKVELYYD